MEAVSATGAIVGLAVPVFQCAKALRDKMRLVCHSLTLCMLMEGLIPRPRWQGRIGESGNLGASHRI
jgi:hypothetical protein